MRFPVVAAALLAATSVSSIAQTVAEDPYIWLEEKDSPRSLAWVEAHNAVTVKRLEADPRYATLYGEALTLASAKDRIPAPSFIAGEIYNFWQDGDHLRGIWRKTTLADYRTAAPKWQTVLDIDALGKAEGKSWVFKGAQCLQPDETRCLISLSDGGEDAVEFREFDLTTGKFVAGGFHLPRAKSDVAWEDRDHLLVSTEWTPGDLTASGYPYIVKRLARGQPLASAVEIYRGQKSDVAAEPAVIHDGQGRSLAYIQREIDFFHQQKFVVGPAGVRPLTMPEKATIEDLVDGRVIVKLKEDWASAGPQFKAGSVVELNLAQVQAHPEKLAPKLVWSPSARVAVESVVSTKSRLILSTIDNVRGRVLALTPKRGGGWTTMTLDLPDNLALDLGSTDSRSERMFVTASGFTTPSTLYLGDAATGKLAISKTLPAKFDAAPLQVEQLEATSTDGTKIPYFVVHRKDIAYNGATPTLMSAYGGFAASMTPYYSALTGKLWLERGGAFVLANIRGGGEFGPAWHEAGLGVKRQIVYDDFAAVGRDLIARRITSPRRLGIEGGSNGGLLMGVAMIQQPDLWNAIAIQVPLLDMIRISKIAAGASWQGEYGDVNADPAVMAFWRKTSPYQNLRKDGKYPEPFIFTTTKDDRTGPQHARKFAARMEEYGLPFYYYENTEGGHGSGADIKQSARSNALMMTYFIKKLMD
jgi:prolyl oligopeptidase